MPRLPIELLGHDSMAIKVGNPKQKSLCLSIWVKNHNRIGNFSSQTWVFKWGNKTWKIGLLSLVGIFYGLSF